MLILLLLFCSCNCQLALAVIDGHCQLLRQMGINTGVPIRTHHHSHAGFALGWCVQESACGRRKRGSCLQYLPSRVLEPSIQHRTDELLARLVHAKTGPLFALNFWKRLHVDKCCHNNMGVLGLVLSCSDCSSSEMQLSSWLVFPAGSHLHTM